MIREHDITSRTWGHAPELAPGVRVVTMTTAGSRRRLAPGVIVRGPKILRGHYFQSWLVRRRNGRSRWVSCISIVSAVLPAGRVPA